MSGNLLGGGQRSLAGPLQIASEFLAHLWKDRQLAPIEVNYSLFSGTPAETSNRSKLFFNNSLTNFQYLINYAYYNEGLVLVRHMHSLPLRLKRAVSIFLCNILKLLEFNCYNFHPLSY